MDRFLDILAFIIVLTIFGLLVILCFVTPPFLFVIGSIFSLVIVAWAFDRVAK